MLRKLSRRTVLKASGVAIALPMLEAMGQAEGSGNADAPKRLVLICNALGLYSPSLFPLTPGRDYEATEYLEILDGHRDDFTLFSGLSHPDQSGKEPHDTELTWLTSARNPGLGGFKNSISIDQYAAEQLGQQTRFSTIALSSNTSESQAYTRSGVMVPADNRPSVVFAKLFLNGSPEEQQRQRQRLAEGQSILDLVGEQTRALERRTGVEDRRQLDEYFEAIRSAEAELVEREAWLDRPKPSVDVEPPDDIADPANLIGRTQTLMRLIPLILKTDSSRIVTVMIQDHFAVPTIEGVSSGHHPLSHHGQDPQKIAQLKIIEKEILGCFRGLLDSLSQQTENGNRLLDETSVLFGSNLGNANAHDPANLPIILAGGGYDHGQYVAMNKDNNTPLCNLFVNLLNNLGVDTDQFGTSSGRLEF